MRFEPDWDRRHRAARVTVAFGHGMADWMDQIGARSAAPLALLDETVRAVRGLLGGEKVCRSNG